MALRHAALGCVLVLAAGCEAPAEVFAPATLDTRYTYEGPLEWGPLAWVERPSEGYGYLVLGLTDGTVRAVLRGRLGQAGVVVLERVDRVLAEHAQEAELVVVDVDDDGDDDLLVHSGVDHVEARAHERLWIVTSMSEPGRLLVDIPSVDPDLSVVFPTFFPVLLGRESLALITPTMPTVSGTYLVTRSWLRERTSPATLPGELVVLRSEGRVLHDLDAVVVDRGDRLEIAAVHSDVVDAHTTAYAAGRRTCEPAGAEYRCDAFQAALALPPLSIGWGSGVLLADGALAYVRGGGVGSHGHEPVHALWPGAPASSGRLDDGSPFRPAAARRVGAEVRVVGALNYRFTSIFPYMIGIGPTGVHALGRIRSPVAGPEFDQVVAVRDSAQPRAPVLARYRYRGAEEASSEVDLVAVDF